MENFKSFCRNTDDVVIHTHHYIITEKRTLEKKIKIKGNLQKLQ